MKQKQVDRATTAASILTMLLKQQIGNGIDQPTVDLFRSMTENIIIHNVDERTNRDKRFIKVLAQCLLPIIQGFSRALSQKSVLYGHDWETAAVFKGVNKPELLDEEWYCYSCGCTLDNAPTWCPQLHLEPNVKQLIEAGDLDYIVDHWVRISTEQVETQLCLINLSPKSE